MEVVKSFGWKPSRPDHRDQKLEHHYGFYGITSPQPEAKSDLSSIIDWVYDQGKENSCVAHSAASQIRYARKKAKLPQIEPSRNWIYFEGRAIERDQTRDEGMELRDGFQVIRYYGYCPESLWPYSNTTVFNPPSQEVADASSKNRIGSYAAISQDHEHIRMALTLGYPLSVGIEVCRSMMTREVATTGMVPMPQGPNDKVLGSHAVLIVGHDDSTQKYKVLNSWGRDWGRLGYFYLPYQFVENSDLCADFYTITKI